MMKKKKKKKGRQRRRRRMLLEQIINLSSFFLPFISQMDDTGVRVRTLMNTRFVLLLLIWRIEIGMPLLLLLFD